MGVWGFGDLQLHNVLFVPIFHVNLIYVPQLISESNFYVVVTDHTCFLLQNNTHKMIGSDRLCNRLYMMEILHLCLIITIMVLLLPFPFVISFPRLLVIAIFGKEGPNIFLIKYIIVCLFSFPLFHFMILKILVMLFNFPNKRNHLILAVLLKVLIFLKLYMLIFWTLMLIPLCQVINIFQPL